MVGIGDLSADDTFRAVGIALSRWESMEVGLADLYAIFHRQPFSFALVRAFGQSNRIFAERLTELEKVAGTYFQRRCDQDLEGRFSLLVQRARKLSIVRHQIAHGLVQLTQIIDYGDDGAQYLGVQERWTLASPLYSEARLNMKARDGWSSTEILSNSHPFLELDRSIMAYINVLLKRRT